MLPPLSCQCSWYFSSHDLILVYVRYLQPLWRSDPLYIFSFHGDHDPLYIFIMDILIYILYVVMTTHVIFCIMPINGHCTLMYPKLLYVLVVMCRVWLLYYTVGWLVLPPSSSSLQLWDGLVMYLGHRITPLTSHIRGHLLQLILPHMVDHTFMAFLIPLQTL